MSGVAFETKTQPYSIFFEQRENLFVSYRILMSNHKKLLIEFHKLRYIFTKEGKRRIGDNNICLLQNLNTLCTSEVTITLKVSDTHFIIVNRHISVLITLVYLIDRPLTLTLRKQINILALVACSDKLF